MRILPVSNFRNNYIPKQAPVSFKAHYDGLPPYGNVGDGDRYSRVRIHNYSNLIRDLGLFQDMPKMLEDKFPDGVKIYDYGCSVGYEPVSICLGLHNTLSESQIEKYTPIFAFDNNKKILEKAKDFKLRFGVDEQKRLDKFENIDKNDFFVEHRKGRDGQKLHECKDILKKEIIFEYADLFEDLDNGKLSDEPCVLLLRNAWQYMTPKGRAELAQKLHDNLQPGSIVIIGYHDVSSDANRDLLSAGFEHVNKLYSKDLVSQKYRAYVHLVDDIYEPAYDIKTLCFERK